MRIEVDAVAQYLTVEQHFLELMHFMDAVGVSVGSFARTFGLSKLQAYRKVQRLLKMGLVVVKSEQPRRGKPVKLYSCVHRTFFVPHRLVSLLELLDDPQTEAQLRSALRVALSEVRSAGLMISAESLGRVQMVVVDDQYRAVDPYVSSEAAFILNMGELFLDFEDAKSLQFEMNALLERYHACHGSGLYRYQVILALDTCSRPEASTAQR